MSKKIISVIGMDPRATKSYADAIRGLFGDYAEIRSFNTRDGSAAGALERADLFVVSTDAYGSAEELSRHIPIECPNMAIEVSFRWSTLRELKEIPAGSRVLFVNVTQIMAREAITQLAQFGINHVQFIPFYPGAQLSEPVDMAVTPDEERYIPDSVIKRLNLGQRPCTSGMMIEIALRLGLENLLETEPFQQYFQSIATSNYSFDQMFARSIRLESQFHILMEILKDGVIGVNDKNEIFSCNSHAEEITGVNAALIIGKRGDAVFPYIPFSGCLQEKQTVSAKVRRINGVNVSVEVIPVLRQKECIGAFAVLQRFNDVEMRQSELRKQLLNKGYRAKYSFDDVIGESASIIRTKDMLRRMAVSESPVLLIGETGTGKELFAHAIHQASGRNGGPFVAINVAAIPENLLESELFGYEEGAFTGAKKGGRPGLFELSHGGTLFLDEVEGMSQALQVKLLRALQEKEIMRVGGNRIISINVRVVAATNESLEQKVEDGSFRRDLYYRLSTLPIMIPPLAMREDDMFLLIDYFRKKSGGYFELSSSVRDFLKQYPWPGNIRELRNMVEYFIFTGHERITMEDLPPTMVRNRHVRTDEHSRENENSKPRTTFWPEGQRKEKEDYTQNFWFVLEELYHASQERKVIGRERIYQDAKEQLRPISQKEIRDILTMMGEEGVARVTKGRGGSQLTPIGRQLWEKRMQSET